MQRPLNGPMNRPSNHRRNQRTPAKFCWVLCIAVLLCVGASTESLSDGKSAGPHRKSILEAITYHAEQVRNAPGRTGILAEKKHYSLLDEELIIRDFFQDRKDGFFLDVGCAWPIKASNTYYLEERLGWTGFGVDALEDYAPAWREKRPRSKFFAFLVTDRSGADGRFFKSPQTGLSSTTHRRATGKHYGENMVPEEIRVPMITLDDLLDHEGITKIDLLSMDIEGHELNALAGFDIERFQPDLVVVEGKKRLVAKYFSDHGYELVERYVRFDSINRYFRRIESAAPSGPPPSGD